MNEIDWMTRILKTQVFGELSSKTWLKKPLADRLENLHACAGKRASTHGRDELLTLLAEARSLCDFRNQLAHGTFVINCDMPMTTDPESQLEIFAFGHARNISEHHLRHMAVRCQEVSHSISRQLALTKSELARDAAR